MEPSSHTDDTEPKVYTKISQISSCERSSRIANSGAAAELGRRLLLAARTGDTVAVRVLMSQGAPFTTDWLGTNALHLAAGGGHTAACVALLRAGASHDARNKLERTPLLLAAAAGHDKVIQLLLQHGANVNARDMLHMSALHWAARRGHERAVAILLRHRADVAARDKFLLTPRDLALRHQPQLLPLLDQTENIPTEMIPTDAYTEEEEETIDAEQRTDQEEIVVSEAEEEKEEEVEEMQEVPVTPEIKQTNPPTATLGNPSGTAAHSGAAELLALHGITLLPADAGNTVLSALSAGRAVLLSDAGKLMLRDTPPALSPLPPTPTPSTITRVTSIPSTVTSIPSTTRPVIIRPVAPGKPLIKKIIHPNPTIKYMQLPRNAKIVSATKCVPVKSKSSLSRGGVRIIVNKAPQPSPQSPVGDGLESQSPAALQRQLRAALRGVAELSAQLSQARAQLARQNTL